MFYLYITYQIFRRKDISNFINLLALFQFSWKLFLSVPCARRTQRIIRWKIKTHVHLTVHLKCDPLESPMHSMHLANRTGTPVRREVFPDGRFQGILRNISKEIREPRSRSVHSRFLTDFCDGRTILHLLNDLHLTISRIIDIIVLLTSARTLLYS